MLNKITSIPKDEVEALRKTYIGQLNKYNTKEQYKSVYETLKRELSKKTQGIQPEENLMSEEEILQKELEEIDEEIKQKQKEEKRKKKEEEQKKKEEEQKKKTNGN